MAIIYIEFLYPITHYFKTLKSNEATFDLGVPLAVGIVGYIIRYHYGYSILPVDAAGFYSTIITLLAILIGFTISSITIIATTHQKISIPTERSVGDTNLTLYQLMNTVFIYTLFAEIFTLVFNIAAVLSTAYNVNWALDNINLLIVTDIALIAHILLLNIRNITNFYFVFHRMNSDEN